MLLTTRIPAAATWAISAREPTTNAAPPSVRCASWYCSAAPTVSTSSSAARKPSRHSLRTKSSGACRASLVMKITPLPAARSAATASGARSVGASPTQTQPSRSSSTWSYDLKAGESGTGLIIIAARDPASSRCSSPASC